MINRELIRIKTVQLLYSYLLVENPFTLESQPSAPTKEKRFAYSLYLDILFLMARLAKDVAPRSGSPLLETRFIRNIMADDRIRSLRTRSAESDYPFASIQKELAAKIKDSGVYKRFLKSADSNNTDENVWKEIFDFILMPDLELNALIAKRENYTLKGVDRMRSIMEETFANFFASADNIPDALKILNHSMEKARELYFRLLSLPLAITTLREREIDNAQYKLLKNSNDVNPNMRFVENEFVAYLRNNADLQEGIAHYKIDWLAENEGMIRNMLKIIMQSSYYQEYEQFPATDFKMDCELWRNLLKNIIFVDESFLETIEDNSVFWNDDIDVIGSFIIKSIKKLGNTEDNEQESFVLPMFKDREDSEFGSQLFTEVIKRKEYYRELILENIDKTQWEVERLAFMDAVIIMAALAEILTFPKIPLTVSFNEYIEIAKYYSTPRSGIFINGLLGNIVNSLREKGKILKTFNTKK